MFPGVSVAGAAQQSVRRRKGISSVRTAPATVLLDLSRGYSDHRRLRESSWYGYVEGETWGAIPFAVYNLYRGQTAHYSPMLPSIARGLQSLDIAEIWKCSISDQAKFILRLVHSWWFSRELAHHPVAAHAAQQKLDLDPIALAQHYGIPTGYLDLTDDFSVSAFFATCRETKNGWEPMDSGVGVIYRVTLKKLENPFGHYAPLGPQQLPRPTGQCAWVAELPLCHSFEDWPDVAMLKFHHDKRIGEYFLDMFGGGKQLFPPDPLADVAAEILACGEVPGDLVEAALESLAKDQFGIRAEQLPPLRKELSRMTAFIGNRRLLTDQHVSSLLADSEWRAKMLADVRVKWRAVRRVPVSQTGSEKNQ